MRSIIFFILILSNISYGSEKILASCYNAKSELMDIGKETTKGYEKDSLKINLIIRGEKVYIGSNTGESELIYLGGKNPQFLEEVQSGHNVLYTYYPNSKLLTMQKSYDFFGPIMVNVYLKCK